MISKIYVGFLAVSAALMAFFTYYSWSWLQSIGRPDAAVEGYEYHAAYSLAVLWVTSIALLLLGNVNMWLNRNAWALWTTFAYFVVFVLIHYLWLDQALFQFQKANGMWDGSFSIGPVLGVILVAIAAVVIFFDQFALVRLQRKMYPPIVAEMPEAENDPESATD